MANSKNPIVKSDPMPYWVPVTLVYSVLFAMFGGDVLLHQRLDDALGENQAMAKKIPSPKT